jgi:hypothetical protein
MPRCTDPARRGSPATTSLPYARFLRILLALASSATLGCRHEPTYYEDVAPILESKCMPCHRPGGLANVPPMGSFEQAAASASRIRRSVQMREMPPWGAENSGLCGTWREALWLEDDEMRVLERWTKKPLPGDLARAKPPAPPPSPDFRPSGVVLDNGGDYRPMLGPSTYRCFVVGPADARDRTATAFRIVSTEPRSVRQVTLYALDSAEDEAAAVALDREAPGLGYSCFGSSRVPGARLLTSWTWGSPVSEMPPGVGVRLPGGRKLVLQINYDPMVTGLDVPTRTRIELALDDRARVARYLTIAPETLEIPPGQIHTEVRAEATVARALRVLGVVPRMHMIGTTMQLDRSVGDAFRCMGSFDHWSFYRRRLFSYAGPIDLDRGSRLRLSCAYDTRSQGAPTGRGDGIDDEECRADLLVVDL